MDEAFKKNVNNYLKPPRSGGSATAESGRWDWMRFLHG